MANHKSAEKRIRQTEKRTAANRIYRTKLKNIVKDVRGAVAKKDGAAADEALDPDAQRAAAAGTGPYSTSTQR